MAAITGMIRKMQYIYAKGNGHENGNENPLKSCIQCNGDTLGEMRYTSLGALNVTYY